MGQPISVLHSDSSGVFWPPTMLFKDPTAVQLRVALVDIEPVIWRRLVVPWTFDLGQLHQVI
jgi:Plasmid pRiA4b ORF-3-like protein